MNEDFQDSGPFCQHWSDSDCDECRVKCDACGHECRDHEDDDGHCNECDCAKFVAPEVHS